MPRSSVDELLAAVDVEGRAGHRGVRPEAGGQCGDVGRADDAVDRQRGTELLAALVDLIAGQRPPSGGVAGVTDTRVPSSKTSDTPRAE